MKKIFLILISIVGFNSRAAVLPADDTACSHEYQSAVGYYSYALDMPTLGLSAILPLIAKDMCPDISERIDQIDSRLTNIEGTLEKLNISIGSVADGLENLGNSLESFQKEVYDNLVERDRLKYEENLEDFDRYVRYYRQVYAPESSMKNYSMKARDVNGNKLDFIGLYSDDFKFADKISHTTEFINLLKDIVVIPQRNESPVLMKYLYKLCGSAENIQGDVLRQRQGCNSIIVGILHDIDIRAMQAQAILLDEIDTVNLAMSRKNINQKWLDSAKGRTLGLFNNQVPWLNASKEAIAITDKYRDDITKLFALGASKSERFFPIYKDFPKDKYDMINRVCSDPKTHLPGIIRWYTHLPTSNEPFVITECLSNEKDPTSVVRSKVYYNRATRLDNILGVLVNPDAKKSTWNREGSFNAPITLNCYNCFVAYPGVPEPSGLNNVKFMLNSNIPLELNSVTATTKWSVEKGATKINEPDMSFIQSGLYESIRPVYTFKSKIDGQMKVINLADANISYSNTVSKLLYPLRTMDGSMSKTFFLSNIYNSPIYLKDTYYPSLSTTVYLSFKAEGFKFENGTFVIEKDISYVFGLAIFNGNGGPNEGGGPFENIALVCLDNRECLSRVSSGSRTDDKKYGGTSVIQWFNGLSVEMNGDNAGHITLKVNTKVDPTKNEDGNLELKKNLKLLHEAIKSS